VTTEGGGDRHPARSPGRWHPARWLRRQPLLRGLIAVLTSGGAFAVLAAGLTVAGVAQRRGVWLDVAPRMFAAQQAAFRAAGTGLDPSQVTVEQWLTWAPTPWASAGPIAVHVLAQTLLFVTVACLVQVLGRAGRAVAAAGVTLVTAAGVIVSAGPLALLPGTLAHATTLASRGTTTPSIDYSAPWWWRALAAGAVLLPLGAVAVTALRSRPPGRPAASRGRTAASTAAFLLVAEVTVLVLPGSLFPDDVTTAPAALTSVALLALGWAGADAGSREPRVRGLAVGVLLSTLGGLA